MILNLVAFTAVTKAVPGHDCVPFEDDGWCRELFGPNYVCGYSGCEEDYVPSGPSLFDLMDDEMDDGPDGWNDGDWNGGGWPNGRRLEADTKSDAELTLDEAAAEAPIFRRAAGDWCQDKWDCAANEECANVSFGWGQCRAGTPDASRAQPQKKPKCSGHTYGPCSGGKFCEYQSRSGSYKCVWGGRRRAETSSVAEVTLDEAQAPELRRAQVLEPDCPAALAHMRAMLEDAVAFANTLVAENEGRRRAEEGDDERRREGVLPSGAVCLEIITCTAACVDHATCFDMSTGIWPIMVCC